jgi:hypothetical protein
MNTLLAFLTSPEGQLLLAGLVGYLAKHFDLVAKILALVRSGPPAPASNTGGPTLRDMLASVLAEVENDVVKAAATYMKQALDQRLSKPQEVVGPKARIGF